MSWKELQAKWEVDAEEKRRQRALAAEPLSYKLTTPVGRTNTHDIPSRVTPGSSTASISKVYTGTKVKGIRLVKGDHDIDCKIDGIGAMKLKSMFVKKV